MKNKHITTLVLVQTTEYNMKLLNLSEHYSCCNYQFKSKEGFARYKVATEECRHVDNKDSFCILFLLKGELLIDSGIKRHIHLIRNNMFLIPQREKNRIESVTPAEYLVLHWNKEVRTCNKLFFSTISHEKTEYGGDRILPIRKPLLHVLRQLSFYLDVGLLCRHMHTLKQQEISLVLRGFYTMTELGSFFFGISGEKNRFEDFVLDNYQNVKTVKEFASLYCVSERSFNRKFQESFDQSPYSWMQERKSEFIREKICDPDITFREIAAEFGFSSQAHLTSYCKKYFGATPTELREGKGEKIEVRSL